MASSYFFFFQVFIADVVSVFGRISLNALVWLGGFRLAAQRQQDDQKDHDNGVAFRDHVLAVVDHAQTHQLRQRRAEGPPPAGRVYPKLRRQKHRTGPAAIQQPQTPFIKEYIDGRTDVKGSITCR
jgi:hypothetical protein